MFKIAGIFCILLGCAGWGTNKIREEQRRIRYLREMILVIRRICDEISYGKNTLPEICLILTEFCSPLYRAYFQRIYEQAENGSGASLDLIWVQQMENCLHGTPLSDEEKDILKYLPQHVRMQEEKLQAKNIGLSVELLARNCRKAEDTYENKARMILSVSIMTGVFLVILLL